MTVENFRFKVIRLQAVYGIKWSLTAASSGTMQTQFSSIKADNRLQKEWKGWLKGRQLAYIMSSRRLALKKNREKLSKILGWNLLNCILASCRGFLSSHLWRRQLSTFPVFSDLPSKPCWGWSSLQISGVLCCILDHRCPSSLPSFFISFFLHKFVFHPSHFSLTCSRLSQWALHSLADGPME